MTRMVEMSGALRTVAVSLYKIANDIRCSAPARARGWAS
jgi:fumarate hydratase class II